MDLPDNVTEFFWGLAIGIILSVLDLIIFGLSGIPNIIINFIPPTFNSNLVIVFAFLGGFFGTLQGFIFYYEIGYLFKKESICGFLLGLIGFSLYFNYNSTHPTLFWVLVLSAIVVSISFIKKEFSQN